MSSGGCVLESPYTIPLTTLHTTPPYFATTPICDHSSPAHLCHLYPTSPPAPPHLASNQSGECVCPPHECGSSSSSSLPLSHTYSSRRSITRAALYRSRICGSPVLVAARDEPLSQALGSGMPTPPEPRVPLFGCTDLPLTCLICVCPRPQILSSLRHLQL